MCVRARARARDTRKGGGSIPGGLRGPLTLTWLSVIPKEYAKRALSGPAKYFVCSKVFSRAKICWPENVGLVCFLFPSLSNKMDPWSERMDKQEQSENNRLQVAPLKWNKLSKQCFGGKVKLILRRVPEASWCFQSHFASPLPFYPTCFLKSGYIWSSSK